MIWRRWVTEIPPSLRHNLAQLTSTLPLSNTRTRPPHSGFVQVGYSYK